MFSRTFGSSLMEKHFSVSKRTKSSPDAYESPGCCAKHEEGEDLMASVICTIIASQNNHSEVSGDYFQSHNLSREGSVLPKDESV